MPGRETMWLRLDRTKANDVSFSQFLWNLGETAANDFVQLVGRRENVVEKGRLENVQEFGDIPMMRKLCHLLGIIIEEMVTYQLWPKNCWFFCSLIQECLGDTSNGRFAQGKAEHGGLAPDVSSRVKARFNRYKFTPTLSEWISCIEGHRAYPSHILEKASVALDLSVRWDTKGNFSTRYDTELCDGLVDALVALAVALRETSQPGKANFISERAINLARELHKHSPRRRCAALASRLHLLSAPLHDPVCIYDTCVSKRSVVLMQRVLYEEESSASNLGDFLRQHGDRFHAEGKYDDACTAKEEAVDICYEYYEANPSMHTADLASFLDSYGVSLHASERYTDACAVKQDAVALRKMLGSDSPKGRENLARSLYALGVSLHEERRYDDACLAHKQAIGHLRVLYSSDPTAYRDDLARSLLSYSASLHMNNKNSDACDVSAEAVGLYRRTVQSPNTTSGERGTVLREVPESNPVLLAACYDQHGVILHSVGRHDDECKAKENAVHFSRKAYQHDSDANCINLAKHLFSFGVTLHKVKRYEDACENKKEAIELLDGLSPDDRRKHSGRLIKYLKSYSKSLDRAGRSDEARDEARKASELQSIEPSDGSRTVQAESTYFRRIPDN